MIRDNYSCGLKGGINFTYDIEITTPNVKVGIYL